MFLIHKHVEPFALSSSLANRFWGATIGLFLDFGIHNIHQTWWIRLSPPTAYYMIYDTIYCMIMYDII
jgi:hypothetical protein